MSGNLATRLERLEAVAGARTPTVKLVRMCFSHDEIAAVHREAAERGLSDDEVQIIHIVPFIPSGLERCRMPSEEHGSVLANRQSSRPIAVSL